MDSGEKGSLHVFCELWLRWSKQVMKTRKTQVHCIAVKRITHVGVVILLFQFRILPFIGSPSIGIQKSLLMKTQP